MKLIAIVALALVAVTYAVEEPPKILKSVYEQTADGYAAGYETENGITAQETGSLKDAVDADNKPIQILTRQGSWSYVDPAGHTQSIIWTADENGYQAIGESVPKRR